MVMQAEAPLAGMDAEKGSVTSSDVRKARKLKAATVVWRLLTFASALAAFVVMVTNEQTRGGLRADYRHAHAYVWFAVGNGVGCVYALVTAALAPLIKSGRAARWLLLADVLVAAVLMAAASAATAVAYVEDNGLREAGWQARCDAFPRYCSHTRGALVAAFHGWLYLTLCVVVSLCHTR